MFPITFSSPAEAVKAIYEMKQSNPSAIIKIAFNDTTYEVGVVRCILGKLGFLNLICDNNTTIVFIESTGELLYRGEFNNIKSITITSIQSVEPKLKRGDNVYIISKGITAKILEVPTANIYGTHYTNYSFFTVSINNSHEYYPLRDLMKLPSNIKIDA